MIAYDAKHCHVVLIVRLIIASIAGTPPFFVEQWCQSELKRTLRQAADRKLDRLDAEICVYQEAHSAGMVNAKFPERDRYGFEIMDADPSPPTACTAPKRPDHVHQSKIYGKSNDSNFKQI